MRVKVNTTVSVPFGAISWIIWIVFMILYYGVKVDWLTPFWVWFPFWIPFAIAGTCELISLICYAVIKLIDR